MKGDVGIPHIFHLRQSPNKKEMQLDTQCICIYRDILLQCPKKQWQGTARATGLRRCGSAPRGVAHTQTTPPPTAHAANGRRPHNLPQRRREEKNDRLMSVNTSGESRDVVRLVKKKISASTIFGQKKPEDDDDTSLEPFRTRIFHSSHPYIGIERLSTLSSQLQLQRSAENKICACALTLQRTAT